MNNTHLYATLSAHSEYVTMATVCSLYNQIKAGLFAGYSASDFEETLQTLYCAHKPEFILQFDGCSIISVDRMDAPTKQQFSQSNDYMLDGSNLYQMEAIAAQATDILHELRQHTRVVTIQSVLELLGQYDHQKIRWCTDRNGQYDADQMIALMKAEQYVAAKPIIESDRLILVDGVDVANCYKDSPNSSVRHHCTSLLGKYCQISTYEPDDDQPRAFGHYNNMEDAIDFGIAVKQLIVCIRREYE